MTAIKYSIICEDIAHKIFIEALLKSLENNALRFNINVAFYKQFRANNSKDVMKIFPQAIDRSFLKIYLLDLVLIAIDYDDRNREQFANEYQLLHHKISEKGQSKTVILFPVQAIEHWLLLLQHRTMNPTSTKNISGDIEKIQRKGAKLKLYNGKTKSVETIIASILKEADFDWLQQHSTSFKESYQRLLNFIANHK